MEHFLPLLVAAALVGLAKGGLTAAAGASVPLLAFFMNPLQAAAILLPIYIFSDVFAVWFYRRDYSRPNLVILMPAMVIGVVLAALVAPYAPEPVLLAVTGLIGVWGASRSFLGALLRRRSEGAEAPAPPADPKPGPGYFWGVLIGITSFITHSGAPPAQAFLLPQRLSKLKFAGTIAIAFAFINVVKLFAYHLIGQTAALQTIGWVQAASLVAAAFAGVTMGRWIVLKLNDASFFRITEVMLLILSLALIYKAASAAF